MYRRLLTIGFLLFSGLVFSQGDSLKIDTIKVGLETYLYVEQGSELRLDSLLQVESKVNLDSKFYKDRYRETDLMYKVTDNKGNGFDSLYGTRNMRPILHGVAYRGGANNYYHKTDKRNNHNPIPLDGMHGLCQEGFSFLS